MHCDLTHWHYCNFEWNTLCAPFCYVMWIPKLQELYLQQLQQQLEQPQQQLHFRNHKNHLSVSAVKLSHLSFKTFFN